MALGAQRLDVLKLMIGQGMKLTLAGAALGLGVSVVVTRLLKSMLFGVSETDPTTLVMAALVLVAVALVACYIPARRALKIDPMTTLKYE
jgi:putative ABC transport system permease protein